MSRSENPTSQSGMIVDPGDTPDQESRSQRIIAFILAAFIFCAVTGYGVLNAGNTADDWRLKVGNDVDHWRSIGRWALYLLFRYVFEADQLILQLCLGFLCLAWISRALTVYAVADARKRPWFGLLIFVAGVNHIYMVDALHFDLAVFAFPLSLVCSLVAFGLMIQAATTKSTWLIRVLLGLAAIQILALELAIYEPFVFFGAILPILALIRSDRFSLRSALGLLCLSIALIVCALVLHRVQWTMIVDARYRAEGTFHPPVDIVEQLSALPTAIRHILSGNLLLPPLWIKVPLFGIALLAGAAPAIATYIRIKSVTAVPVLRAAAAGLLVVIGLPTLYWFATLQNYSPPRGLSYLGFWEAALLCAASTILGRAKPWLAAAVMATLVCFAVINVAASAMAWRDRAKLSRAEVALASDIVGALESLPGYTNQRVRLIGTRNFQIYNWGPSLGLSVFHRGDPIFQEPYPLHGLFKDGFGNPRRFESPYNSNISCPAFPAPGSVFLRDGFAYVCLAENGPQMQKRAYQ